MVKYLDSAGLTHLWAKVKNYVSSAIDALKLSDTYVAKEEGMGLSSNDYTTAEKEKLSGIAAGAEVNTIESMKLGGAAVPVANKVADIPLSSVKYNATAKKFQLTVKSENAGEQTADMVTAAKIVADGGGLTEHQDISGLAPKATTLAGYGITDAKIVNGKITLGTQTITPLTSHQDISGLAPKATTLAGYGITDAKILNGVITLGAETITPLTEHQDISGLAPKASPTFTGTPKAPTAAAGTDTDQIATTSFVKAAIDNASGSYIATSVRGQANGVAELDANGKVPSSQLPSYVDDVIEVYARSGQTALSENWFATGSASGSVVTPETGKIYVLMADSGNYSENSQFRWGGTSYVRLNDGGVSALTTAEIDSICAN